MLSGVQENGLILISFKIGRKKYEYNYNGHTVMCPDWIRVIFITTQLSTIMFNVIIIFFNGGKGP